MNKDKQSGSTAVIAIIIVVVLIVGGVVAYALTTGSNGNDENETSTSTADNSESQQNDSAQDDEDTLPADFPGSVPIYEPSSVTAVNTSGTNYVVGFMTDSSKADVVAFYETELENNGWSVVMSDDNGRFTAANDGMNIVADVTEAGDGAIFTVTAPQQ